MGGRARQGALGRGRLLSARRIGFRQVASLPILLCCMTATLGVCVCANIEFSWNEWVKCLGVFDPPKSSLPESRERGKQGSKEASKTLNQPVYAAQPHAYLNPNAAHVTLTGNARAATDIHSSCSSSGKAWTRRALQQHTTGGQLPISLHLLRQHTKAEYGE